MYSERVADPVAVSRDELRALAPSEWPVFLAANSGLPGPRANLELADAFAALASRDLILCLADSNDEYERFCGTEALGRLLLEGEDVLPLLRERASDESWRVREAAARALQIVGDAKLEQLRGVAAEWMHAPEPYVQRAALAAICEPRLLGDPAMQTAALDACAVATRSIVAAKDRKDAAVRNLRQALGYCWSVAVAGDPVRGLPAFAELRRDDDPDVRWIVASNLKKQRLKRLLA
jgi:HEAT repeat protein